MAVEIEPVEDGDTLTPSNGVVAFFDATSGAFLDTVEVGVLPDAVSFTPDGSRLQVTNEGEFNSESDVTVDARAPSASSPAGSAPGRSISPTRAPTSTTTRSSTSTSSRSRACVSPDAIKVFEIDGRTLIATANEGDGRGDAFSFDEDDNVTGNEPEGDEARVSEVLATAAAGFHPGFDDGVDTTGLERLTISPFDGGIDETRPSLGARSPSSTAPGTSCSTEASISPGSSPSGRRAVPRRPRGERSEPGGSERVRAGGDRDRAHR